MTSANLTPAKWCDRINEPTEVRQHPAGSHPQIVTKQRKGLSPIMSSPRSVNTPLSIGFNLTEAMSRIDACPTACGNTEAPRATVPTGDGWMASHLCADCGHAWTTSWKD